MNKKLTPLNAIIQLRNRLVEKGIKEQFLDELLVIESALKRLESLEDTRYIILGGRDSGKSQKLNALLKLKAFEIIKKYVSVRESYDDTFPYDIVDKQYISTGSCLVISKEEYDLLKEVLDD